MTKEILAVILAAAPAAAAEFDLNSTGLAEVRESAAQVTPVSEPAKAEKPCKRPGPNATIAETIAWIRCVPLPPLPTEEKACRLAVSEIGNRWIASIYVTSNNLKNAAASLQGLAPSQGPAGHAYEAGAAARRVSAAAEAMVGYWQDRRWGMLQLETEKLDRVIPTLLGLEASIKGRPNYSQLKGPELARAAADLASALQWLRADSGGMLR